MMNFSDNLKGRLFSWGGANFLIIDTEGDSVIAVYRDNAGVLERVRVSLSQALQTIDAVEVTVCDVPEPAQVANH